ncbi:MAG: glycosyltransferase [Candidatus Marinimicrobia bacterium]|nr:glycosyltransferase [Candidatus Neomarinimicrobiota bacterium]
MKILYISPENTVGTLTYWKKAHEANGHDCRYVTFFPSSSGYKEDICLHLPFLSASRRYVNFRLWFLKNVEKKEPWKDLGGNPPVWDPPAWQKGLFQLRELLWIPIIHHAIKKYALDEFDIIHFEWGTDFFRNGKFARKMKTKGKKIVCHYHGQDMRNRGVIPAMDELSDLNLTNELDLTHRHPNIHYLFLPYDVRSFHPKQKLNNPITICHATTNRKVKGSDKIIEVCQKLEKTHHIRFIFIENMPHDRLLKLKAEADIYIDQITDHAPGYGMNSLESLSMGIASVTFMNADFQKFIPDHPFISAGEGDLEEKLIELIEDREGLWKKCVEGRNWVDQVHDYHNVVQKLYQYYHEFLKIEI